MSERKKIPSGKGTLPDALDKGLNRVFVALFPLLLLLAMTVQTSGMAFFLAILAMVATLGKTPAALLRERLGVALLGFFFYALMNLLAAVYAPVGSTAVQEAVKILASLSLSVIVVLRFRRENARYFLWGFGAVCAILALLCVDAGCDGPLFAAFSRGMNALGMRYDDVVGTAGGSRINGIYNDGNISAGILALSSLVMLYLTLTAQRWWQRLCGCVLLGVSAMGFFLALSRGAILMFVLALAVYLAVSGADRTELFFLMAETALCTVALSALAMGHLTGETLLPQGLTLVCGVPVFVLHTLLGRPLTHLLAGRGRAFAAVLAVLAVCVVGYAVAALQVTGAYTFQEAGRLFRATDLSAGDYTLSVQWSGEEPETVIYTTDNLGATTSLYQGPASGAAFTLDQADTVFVRFDGAAGTTLERADFSDGTAVKLQYKLLPAFVAARLQDSLSGSKSTWLRWQYDQDGLALFAQKPLTGYGLGGTEAWLSSVQPYYYESAYVHNHLIQAMADMGLPGLAAVLMLMLGVLWLLVGQLRRQSDPLAAMLLACWVMMNAHGLMELNFSIRAYQCVAYSLLLLAVACYGRPLKWLSAKVWAYGALVWVWLFGLVFTGLLGSHYQVDAERDGFTTSDVDVYMNKLYQFATRDRLDPEDFQIRFVAQAAAISGENPYAATMENYVGELRKNGTYAGCTGLAKVYYLPQGQLEETFAAAQQGLAQIASNADAWNEQVAFYRAQVLPAITAADVPVFVSGVLQLEAYLDTYSQGRQEEIVFTEANQAFLDTVNAIRGSGLTDSEAYQLLLSRM